MFPDVCGYFVLNGIQRSHFATNDTKKSYIFIHRFINPTGNRLHLSSSDTWNQMKNANKQNSQNTIRYFIAAHFVKSLAGKVIKYKLSDLKCIPVSRVLGVKVQSDKC